MDHGLSIKQAALKLVGAVNRILRPIRVQIVWLTDFDLELERGIPNDLVRPGFRELTAMRAIAMPGEVSLEEAKFLGELVERTESTEPIVEIGVLFGRSTSVLALFKNPKQPLIGVDNFCWNPLDLSPAHHEYATRRVLDQAISKYNVTIESAEKTLFFANYDGPAPGLVFCDADHSYEATLEDINWARSVGARIVCGHDYGEDERVTAAVDSLGGPKELVGRVFVV